MVKYRIVFSKFAVKDPKKAAHAGLKPKILALLEIMAVNPYQNPPPFEKLVGDLQGAYSRRITLQHRLIYQVLDEQRIIKILRMWTRYE